ncbi:hypothetical protein EMEDMD4_10028 [Sinorhizobium medicae]|uniref:Uncharacterized protein n=1 Tax=Sinorhizobium medicae TaxID=110321 RepID=A0A508WNA1_9HYPH|nr:hypothetical protein EMEDMD4_10028 [Sinorhizobium medicae]
MICVPCGRHLGRIARQDQSRFLSVHERRQLTLVLAFACRSASPSRIPVESTVLFFAVLFSWRKRKKIKNGLTHSGLNPVGLQDNIFAATSRKPLILLKKICHWTDMSAAG